MTVPSSRLDRRTYQFAGVLSRGLWQACKMGALSREEYYYQFAYACQSVDILPVESQKPFFPLHILLASSYLAQRQHASYKSTLGNNPQSPPS